MRGRPILGGFAGFFLGAFVALDLFVLGVVRSNSALMVALPVVLSAFGVALGAWAPLRRR